MVSIGDVWDRTTEFVSDHLRNVLPIAILAILIPATISANSAAIGTADSPALRAGIAALGLGASLLSLWGQLAITSLAIDGVGARRATQRLGPAIGVFLLLGLGIAAIVLAAYIAAALIGGVDLSQVRWSAQAPQMPPGIGWGFGLTMLIVLAALIAILVRLAPLTAVIVAERRGAGAIARAFRLTHGLAWKLLGVVLLYAVVSIVSQWAATAVFGSVLSLIIGGEGPFSIARVVTSVIAAAVQTAFSVLAAAFAAKLYLACVVREEQVVLAATAPLS